MKFLAALDTILILLSLGTGSIGTADEDARSAFLRTRKLANTVSFSSLPGIEGRLLNANPSLPDRISSAFESCVDDWEDGEEPVVYCDIYFNPHTGKLLRSNVEPGDTLENMTSPTLIYF